MEARQWRRDAFLAQNNQYAPGEPTRGGIPVVFPQFGSMGTLPMHGLLKAAMWEIVESSKDPNGAAYVLLRTSDTEVTRGLWPHPFRATLRVTLDEALSTSLTIENTGAAPFEFQAALHTYLRVGDVRRVTIQGLERATYQDWRRKGVQRREGSAPLRIAGAINRVYLRRPDRISVYDESRGRTVLIDRAGFGDVVVWNPGEKDAHDLRSRRGRGPHDARRRGGAGRAEGAARTGPDLERHPASPPRRDLRPSRSGSDSRRRGQTPRV